MVEKLIKVVLENPRIVFAGDRFITRMTTHEERYLIYLPTSHNDLWRVIWEGKVKVKVFIEVPETINKEPSERGALTQQ